MNKKAYRGKENQTLISDGGIAYVYRLDPPFEYRDWYGSEKKKQAEYVFVSGIIIPTPPSLTLLGFLSESETSVFLCDENGEVLNWAEIVRWRGYIDPDAAIKEMGYEIIVEE